MNGSFAYDVFGARPLYGTSVAGTTPITDFYAVSVSLDAFSYGNSGIPVSGQNTDVELVGPDGNTYSIENGNISGAAGWTPPTLALSSPAAKVSTTNGTITIFGKAVDNAGLAGVYCIVNNDTANPLQISGPYDGNLKMAFMDLSTNLLSDPDFFAGTNVLQFYAVDTAGNVSAIVTSAVFYEEVTNITSFSASGSGTVSGLKTGQTVVVGEAYPVTATAGKGFVFQSWTDGSGNYITNTSTFRYVAGSSADLMAVFVPNPYPALKGGQYTGLFYDPINGVTPTNAGYFTLALTPSGGYSAKLSIGPNSYSIASGQFLFPPDAAQGDTTNVNSSLVSLSAATAVSIQLLLNVDTNLADPGAGFLTGTVTAYNNSLDTNYWVDSLTAELSDYVSSTNTEPGLYNLAISPVGSDLSQAPGGYSYGSATLSAKGAVSLALYLADGTATSFTLGGTVGPGRNFSVLQVSLRRQRSHTWHAAVHQRPGQPGRS